MSGGTQFNTSIAVAKVRPSNSEAPALVASGRRRTTTPQRYVVAVAADLLMRPRKFPFI